MRKNKYKGNMTNKLQLQNCTIKQINIRRSTNNITNHQQLLFKESVVKDFNTSLAVVIKGSKLNSYKESMLRQKSSKDNIKLSKSKKSSHKKTGSSQSLHKKIIVSPEPNNLRAPQIKKIKLKANATKEALQILKKQVVSMKNEVEKLKSQRSIYSHKVEPSENDTSVLRQWNQNSHSMIISPQQKKIGRGQSFLSEQQHSNNQSKIHISEEYLFCDGKEMQNKENMSFNFTNISQYNPNKKRNEQALHYTDYYLQN